MILKVEFSENTATFKANFGEIYGVSEDNKAQIYDGEYVITPSTKDEQILKTGQKMMVADVKVKKIPYFEVSNNANGTTVTIGSEV